MVSVVTGAYGYTGKYIAERLLAMGERVINLTGHPGRESPFGEHVKAFPFSFDDPGKLVDILRGASTLYNTYWVRFPHRGVTYEEAVQNTRILIQAAEDAGLHRIVHISITSASSDSPLPYFHGKGQVEEIVRDSHLSYAILRPSVIFGREDILINNIAWLLRRFPLFAIPGNGDYRLQPVYVEDVAEMAVISGQGEENTVVDAVGPEIHTFDELVRLIAQKVRSKARIIHIPPALAFFMARFLGYLVKDVMLTKDEVNGLMAGLLVSESTPEGKTRLSDWLERYRDTIGVSYASELKRHYRQIRIPSTQPPVDRPR